jgi:hypothetical protein
MGLPRIPRVNHYRQLVSECKRVYFGPKMGSRNERERNEEARATVCPHKLNETDSWTVFRGAKTVDNIWKSIQFQLVKMFICKDQMSFGTQNECF